MAQSPCLGHARRPVLARRAARSHHPAASRDPRALAVCAVQAARMWWRGTLISITKNPPPLAVRLLQVPPFPACVSDSVASGHDGLSRPSTGKKAVRARPDARMSFGRQPPRIPAPSRGLPHTTGSAGGSDSMYRSPFMSSDSDQASDLARQGADQLLVNALKLKLLNPPPGWRQRPSGWLAIGARRLPGAGREGQGDARQWRQSPVPARAGRKARPSQKRPERRRVMEKRETPWAALLACAFPALLVGMALISARWERPYFCHPRRPAVRGPGLRPEPVRRAGV